MMSIATRPFDHALEVTHLLEMHSLARAGTLGYCLLHYAMY